MGEVPESGGRLPSKLTPATISVDQLVSGADKSRNAIRYSTRSCGDAQMDAALYEKTLSEVDRGWLQGPLPWPSLEEGAVISKRFPLQQGEKLRPIDDYSMSLVNATVTTRDQATTDNIDVICAMLTSLIHGLHREGRSSEILARSFDLSAAYRQLCVSAASRPFSYICVYNPFDDRADVFSQVCLPFGSRTAVNAFIRCSRCIQWIAANCLLLPLTCYYDDFVLPSTPDLAANSESCMSMLFDLLRWAFDKTGPKADTFSQEVKTLGVCIDLRNSAQGYVEASNTAKRRKIHWLLLMMCCKLDSYRTRMLKCCEGGLHLLIRKFLAFLVSMPYNAFLIMHTPSLFV